MERKSKLKIKFENWLKKLSHANEKQFGKGPLSC